MPTVIERMREALNQHDLEAFLGCFDQNYRSEQPIHPNRGFGGKEQVRKNWSSIFESFPDFKAELIRYTLDDETVWSEWHWTATGLNMAGVTGRGRRGEHRRGHAAHDRKRQTDQSEEASPT